MMNRLRPQLNFCQRIAICFIVLIFSSSVNAITASFSGELIEIPCTFSNSADLDFDFKDVVAQEVDGINHAVEQRVDVSCYASATLPTQLLSLTINGSHLAGAADNIVDSGLPNLGIALTNSINGNELPLGQPIKDIGVAGASSMSFILKATLINNSTNNATLDAGDFSTDLVLSAKYE
ncbi:fimbrial protein [Hafnia alvei]|uniref:fimbrial protein n=1 Tax=Hafnia alvei TaxID=569 RepID=UPI00345C6C30